MCVCVCACQCRSCFDRLEHPHIVKMYECFEERQSLWVVSETQIIPDLLEGSSVTTVKKLAACRVDKKMSKTFSD